MKRVPLRRRSKKRQRADRQRADLMRALAEVRGEVCQAQLDGCDGRAVDGHEIDTRGRGGSPLEASNVLLVCRNCHTWITEHPTEAAALGLVANSWDTDKPTAPPWGAVGFLFMLLAVPAAAPRPAPSRHPRSPRAPGVGSRSGAGHRPVPAPDHFYTVDVSLDRTARAVTAAIDFGWTSAARLLSAAICDANRTFEREHV